jgi:hypothetical protein
VQIEKSTGTHNSIELDASIPTRARSFNKWHSEARMDDEVQKRRSNGRTQRFSYES